MSPFPPATRTLLILAVALGALVARSSGAEPSLPRPDESITNCVHWKLDTSNRNEVAWYSRLGTHSGALVVTRDLVFVGTNNGYADDDKPRDSKIKGDQSLLVCFNRVNGEFLWQLAHPRIPDRMQDVAWSPIQSRTAVDGDRAYYISNRDELVCVDLKATLGAVRAGRAYDQGAPPIDWKLDMIDKLKVHITTPGDIGNVICSPLVCGDYVYCLTGNGRGWDRDYQTYTVVNPEAPSFVAVSKKDGSVVWTSNLPGKNILKSQWSSPFILNAGKQTQIVFPAGDGCLYALEPLTGKLVWKLDCNAARPDYRQLAEFQLGYEFTRPALRDGLLCIGLDQGFASDQANGSALLCLEAPTGKSAAPPLVKWTRVAKGEYSVAAPVLAGDSVYTLTNDGLLLKFDAASGRVTWRADLIDQAGEYSSPVLDRDRLYVPTETGIIVFQVGTTPKCLGCYEFESVIEATPVILGDQMYVATRSFVAAINLKN